MAATRRLNQVLAELRESIVPVGEPVVVGLSGGADSAMLAWLLKDSGHQVRAVHIDHDWPDSPRMVHAARKVAESVGVDLKVVSVEAPPGPSPEATARTARYKAFNAECGAKEVVATAHTKDDQAETVLINLVRGSGVQGLAGIPERRDRIVRPLLRVSRSLLREAATLLCLPWVDDPANSDDRFLRVRIRSRLLPLMEAEFNRDVVDSLARFAGLAEGDARRLESEASVTPETYGRTARVPLGPMATLDPALAARVVRRMWGALGFDHPPSGQTVNSFMEVVGGSIERAQVEAEVLVGRDGPYLVARHGSEVESTVGPVDLSVPGETRWGTYRFAVVVDERPPPAALSPWRALIPIVGGESFRVRRPERDDRIRCGDGSKSVADALSESGVAPEARRRYPVVEMDGQVVWIPGVRRVGWPRPHQSRYLSAIAVEETEWRQYEP